MSVRHRLLFLLFCLSLFNLTPVVAADFKTAPRIILELGGHTGRIWDLMFTPDGRQLVTVSYDKSIRVWDVASGKSIRVLRPPSGFGNEGRLVTAALSADGKLIATAGVGVSGSKNAVYLISMKTGEIEAVLLGHTKPINHVAFSPDGKSLVSAGHDQTARLWDLTTRKTLKTFEGHSAFINMVSFSADSKYLATASGDANTIVWNLSTGKKELTLKHGGNCVDASFSIDNKMIATADNSGLSLWSMKGERLGLVKVPQLSAIQFTHASTKVMFAGGLGFVDVKSGAIQRMSADVMTGVAVSPDGQQIATGTPSGEVILWDITRNRRLRPASRPVKRVGWSADGKKIFWTHEGRESSLKKSFSLTKLEFAASLAPKEIEAVKDGPIISQNGITLKIRNDRLAVEVFKGKKKHRNLVVPYFGTGFETISCFTVVKEGQAAIGNNNGEIFLFNIDTGKLVRKLRGHIGEIWSLVPSPDGRYLLSGANDHTLRIWQLDRQDPLMSFCEADGEWVAWTPEGFYASSVGGERMITWQVDQGPKKMAKLYYASQFHDTFFQPDVMAKLLVTGNVEEAVKASATIGVLNNQFYDLRDAELFEQFAPPEVKLVEPAESGTIKTKLLKLRASVRLVNKSPLRDVIILVNGRPQKPETLVQSPDDPRQWNVESEIELVAGRNQIAVL
ncbi:MAG: WD40 repeat domain-containing protein, partial [Planctomycetes bacterium]|nr:WD40 repeat domain-containing protein [Planctomycetota bacterium]